MSHSFVKNHIHLIFGVKNRRCKIDEKLLPELWPYIAGICRNQGMAPIAVNGMNDHAHVLFHLPPVMPLATAVRLIKTNSSKWLNDHGRYFAWQEGYGAFSVSMSKTATVARYIREQQKHHRKMTFEEEYELLLRKHGMIMSPR